MTWSLKPLKLKSPFQKGPAEELPSLLQFKPPSSRCSFHPNSPQCAGPFGPALSTHGRDAHGDPSTRTAERRRGARRGPVLHRGPVLADAKSGDAKGRNMGVFRLAAWLDGLMRLLRCYCWLNVSHKWNGRKHGDSSDQMLNEEIPHFTTLPTLQRWDVRPAHSSSIFLPVLRHTPLAAHALLKCTPSATPALGSVASNPAQQPP